MIKYPEIDPTIFKIGMFEIRWYGLIYIIGFVITYIFAKKNIASRGIKIKREDYDNLIFNLMLGVIIGGRLGYVIFYNLAYYLQNPLQIFAVWHGGMSFHGGALGVILFGLIFSKKHKFSFYDLADSVIPLVSIGLFLGRLGNFINGELWGRETNVPWAMIFPDDPLKILRHPSQLYESFFEGFLLFIITFIIFKKIRRSGVTFWAWIGLYGFFRFFIEFFREPDAQLGHVLGFLTMGQILCLLMIVSALIGLLSLYRRAPNENSAASYQ